MTEESQLQAKSDALITVWLGVLSMSARPLHPVLADQSDEGPVLERGDQWRRRRSFDGGDHPAGLQEIRDGRVHSQPIARHPRLDRDGGYGRSSRADAHPRLGRLAAECAISARCGRGSLDGCPV